MGVYFALLCYGLTPGETAGLLILVLGSVSYFRDSVRYPDGAAL